MADDEAHWHDRFCWSHPTFPAAEPIQLDAQAGTLLLTASQGDEGTQVGPVVTVGPVVPVPVPVGVVEGAGPDVVEPPGLDVLPVGDVDGAFVVVAG